MSAELKIREALADLKPEVLKPWVKLDGLPYLHATDAPKASPWGTPVVGRFDYMETADYIAACHPIAMAELLAELDRLRATPAPGAPAGWINVVDRLPVCNHEDIFIGINTAGFAGAFNAIQEIDGTLYCLYGTPEEEHSVMSDLQWWQRMPAAPGQEAAPIIAYATVNEEGDPAMLFFDKQEAMGYCNDEDEPIPLIAALHAGAGEKTS